MANVDLFLREENVVAARRGDRVAYQALDQYFDSLPNIRVARLAWDEYLTPIPDLDDYSTSALLSGQMHSFLPMRLQPVKADNLCVIAVDACVLESIHLLRDVSSSLAEAVLQFTQVDTAASTARPGKTNAVITLRLAGVAQDEGLNVLVVETEARSSDGAWAGRFQHVLDEIERVLAEGHQAFGLGAYGQAMVYDWLSRPRLVPSVRALYAAGRFIPFSVGLGVGLVTVYAPGEKHL